MKESVPKGVTDWAPGAPLRAALAGHPPRRAGRVLPGSTVFGVSNVGRVETLRGPRSRQRVTRQQASHLVSQSFMVPYSFRDWVELIFAPKWSQ